MVATGCVISTPTGPLALEDEANGYVLHEETGSSRATQQRVTSQEGTWVDGTYAHRATRGNITEPLSVWVTGATPYECQVRMNAIKRALNQKRFTVTFQFGDLQETWICTMPADYTEQYDKPWRHATTGLLRAQVQHLPEVAIAQVAP